MIIRGNAAAIPLKDTSVHCVVSSPPFWGLRKYPIPDLIWGGRKDCAHEWNQNARTLQTGGSTEKQLTNTGNNGNGFAAAAVCSLCSAWRGQLGLEPQLDCLGWSRGENCGQCYFCHLRLVMREVWRVLRDDGVALIDLGDSYAGAGHGLYKNGLSQGTKGPKQQTNKGSIGVLAAAVPDGLKPKDLCGVPARFHLAMLADGWWVRSEIIWAKRAPMPESVQGSHCTRHRITMAEYERLRSLQSSIHISESQPDNLLSLPEQSSQSEVSGKLKGTGDDSSLRTATICQGTKATVQRESTRPKESKEVRSDKKRKGNPRKSDSAAQGQREDPGASGSLLSTPQTRSGLPGEETDLEQAIPSTAERESTAPPGICSTEGDSFTRPELSDRAGLGTDSDPTQASLLLVQKETETEHRPRNPIEQGRTPYQEQFGPGMSSMQFGERESNSDTLLVDCPGCDKCNDGWIVHLSAGRPTSATEKIFLLAKQERYFWDAEAVKESADPSTQRSKPVIATEAVGNTGGNKRTDFEKTRHVVSNRNMRNYWLLAPDPYPDAHFACVDEATECLTLQGWKRHDTLIDGEMVAAYSMSDLKLRWRSLESVARYSVIEETMVRAESASLDMMLTPNHRCIIKRRRLVGDLAQPVIREASALRERDHIPTTAEWDYEGEPFNPIWAELLGWYIAEGYALPNSMSVEISQSLTANAPKVERLRCLLNTVEANFAEVTATRTYRGREVQQTYFKIRGYVAARLRALAPSKALEPYVLAWNHASLLALFNGLIDGDGHRRTDGRMTFIQNGKQTADLIQAIAIRLGWSATVSQRGAQWRVYFTRHNHRSLRGNWGKGVTDRLGHTLKREKYTGIVWCPKTIDGTWVARRNGRVFITGNTFPREIPRRAILAGTSEHGVCGECGAPWVRVTERIAGEPESYHNSSFIHGKTGVNGNGRVSLAERGITKPGGWRPSCQHNAPRVPAIVFDPFGGSSTVGEVAEQLGRRWVCLELAEDYIKQSRKRTRQMGLQLI